MEEEFKKYICVICEHIYDPEDGDLDSDIEPETPFSEVAGNWVCPICGVGKEDFIPLEEEK